MVTFKVAVFGTGMFFAIKWHHDRAKKQAADRTRQGSTPPPVPAREGPAGDAEPSLAAEPMDR
ncbi:MAG: hypothetical protein HY856_02870 [Burkholderiales bacterium]|nr:hypothetical protein [Burkholderiales bacterium]